MTTSRSLERRGAFTLACIMALLVIARVRITEAGRRALAAAKSGLGGFAFGQKR